MTPLTPCYASPLWHHGSPGLCLVHTSSLMVATPWPCCTASLRQLPQLLASTHRPSVCSLVAVSGPILLTDLGKASQAQHAITPHTLPIWQQSVQSHNTHNNVMIGLYLGPCWCCHLLQKTLTGYGRLIISHWDPSVSLKNHHIHYGSCIYRRHDTSVNRMSNMSGCLIDIQSCNSRGLSILWYVGGVYRILLTLCNSLIFPVSR